MKLTVKISEEGKIITNRDVIKIVFPNAEICERAEGSYEYIYVTPDKYGSSWRIRKEWWDLPYKL